MRTYLKDSNSKKIIFLMILKSDHVTGATGKTLTVTVSKNGAAFGAGGGSVAELAGGAYAYTPSAGDVDTLGPILFRATETDCDDCFIEGVVLAVDPYAVKFGLNDLAAGAAMTLTEDGCLAIWNQLLTAITTAGSIGKLIKDYLDAAISSRGTLTAGQVRTELATELARILKGLPDAIPGQNGGLPTTNGTKINQTADLTAGQSIGVSGDLSATMKTSVQTAADAAVTANTKIGAIEADTNELQTNQGNWLTATGFSTHSAADVKAALEAEGSKLSLVQAQTDKMTFNGSNEIAASATLALTESDIAAIVSGVVTGGVASASAVEVIAGEVGQLSVDVAAVQNSIDELGFTLSAEDIEEIVAGIVAAPEISRLAEGTGSVQYTYAVLGPGDVPIPNARVSVYSNSGLTMLVARGTTNDFGIKVFYLDPGTYYFVVRATGWDFENPDMEVVS